jgi:acyl carrier protein
MSDKIQQPPSTPDNNKQPLLALIEQLVKEVHPSTCQHLDITLDSSFDRELGLDSLTRVELLSRVEKKFSISLPERALATAETSRDLLLAIQATGPAVIIETKASPEDLQTSEKGIAAPTTATTLVEVLQYHAERHPERTHIRLYSDEGEGETISYGDLLAEASLLAGGLQAAGIAFGESVLIMLPTGRDYFISFFGVLLAGGVPVPVYPPGRLKQIEEHLRRHASIAANSLSKIMITMPEATSFSRLMHQKVATLDKIATVEEILTLGKTHTLHLPVLATSDTAFLQYTSGSTGMPKGVVLSNANLLANIQAMGRVIEVTSEDVFISWLPLYHDMGLIGAWLGSLYYACPLVIMSPLTFLARPVRWLKAISRYKGTLAAAPNFAYELCRQRIDDEELRDIDLSSWRCAFNGAEAVSPDSILGFADRFAASGFRLESMMPVYGLAESSVGLAFPPMGRGPHIDHIDRQILMKEGKAEPASPVTGETLGLPGCGMPLPGHQIRIVDGNNRELPDRREGIIQFQGPSTTSGYLRNPDQNRTLFHGS